jgi:2,5-diketo-D-gluconate reductase A
MNKKNGPNHVNRREFLQTSAKFAASTVILSMGSYSLMGAVGSTRIENSIPAILLNNGINMPMLGFGTYSLRDSTCVRCVSEAISVGYRLIDTATIYGNEEFVGAGIKESGINREELFITSKVWVDDSGYEGTKKAFETSLNKLGTDYLDLYLIHRPRGDVKGTWKAMEELFKEGKIKAIGLSNFEPDQLENLMEYASIRPTVNQIETHAFFQQPNALEDLNQHEVQMEAWAPFAEGRNGLFTNETLVDIGKKHNKSSAQVSLRWHFQRGIVAIPRTTKKAHMIENLNIFDFELDESDMQTIASLDLNVTQFPEWG